MMVSVVSPPLSRTTVVDKSYRAFLLHDLQLHLDLTVPFLTILLHPPAHDMGIFLMFIHIRCCKSVLTIYSLEDGWRSSSTVALGRFSVSYALRRIE